ncbi:MAG: hypothetical protein Q4D85_02845 [Corynebacterium sp.]|uniref:hypothetical protein n=1 Tax=Corynebacterium sp. TaxID=1720 RepID=UPI0026DBC5B6|nr:hypothetical protein [Corynebacterium sp.]MDO5097668.1 hypothetical protein [Corynebacterium sp.]
MSSIAKPWQVPGLKIVDKRQSKDSGSWWWLVVDVVLDAAHLVSIPLTVILTVLAVRAGKML